MQILASNMRYEAKWHTVSHLTAVISIVAGSCIMANIVINIGNSAVRDGGNN